MVSYELIQQRYAQKCALYEWHALNWDEFFPEYSHYSQIVIELKSSPLILNKNENKNQQKEIEKSLSPKKQMTQKQDELSNSFIDNEIQINQEEESELESEDIYQIEDYGYDRRTSIVEDHGICISDDDNDNDNDNDNDDDDGEVEFDFNFENNKIENNDNNNKNHLFIENDSNEFDMNTNIETNIKYNHTDHNITIKNNNNYNRKKESNYLNNKNTKNNNNNNNKENKNINSKENLKNQNYSFQTSKTSSSKFSNQTLSQIKKQFKKNREQESLRIFHHLNRTVFHRRLPSDMKILFNNRLRTTAGFTKLKKVSHGSQIDYIAWIELSSKVVDRPDRLIRTLAHEMCHAAAWIIDHNSKPPHGAVFRKWASRVMNVHPSIEVTVRHSYQIDYKYHYQCVQCSHVIPKHSKSINTDKKVCGRCFGRLFLLEDQKKKNHQKLAPFSKFIKDHYSQYRKNHPSLSHQALMKLMGQDFKSSK